MKQMANLTTISRTAKTSESSVSLLEEVISNSEKKLDPRSNTEQSYLPLPVIGECIDNQGDPTHKGRVCVAWVNEDVAFEKWLPFIRGVHIQKQDKVLLQYAKNCNVPIIVGVVEALEKPAELDNQIEQKRILHSDESIEVLTETGQPLLKIQNTKEGPKVQLLGEDANIELANNNLCITAQSIALKAHKGDIEIVSDKNVVVEGQEIHLN